MNEDLMRVLDAETEASEATRDEPMVGGVHRDRRSVVYSIRLHPDEAAAIQRVAEAAGVPARGLVRGWVLQALDAEAAGSAGSPVADLHAAMEALAQDFAVLRRSVLKVERPLSRLATQ